jgi:hypothetical protein
LAFYQTTRAVSPPPDGGYPNFTTAEGTNALKNLTTGAANTAVGWFSLSGDTTANFNTGVGAGTLLFDLVLRGKDGKVSTVRYEAVNAMLLNEFLKEHKKVEAQQNKIEKQEAAMSKQDRKLQEQDAIITQLKQGMQILTAQLKEQAAQIQKVSAQLEATKPAPQMAINR